MSGKTLNSPTPSKLTRHAPIAMDLKMGAAAKPSLKQVAGDAQPPKKAVPRRGRKRGRCQLAYCVEEVCIHCTCDGSCGRGHAPKLCGNRRYEKRANCNQCKVAYYCTKRKNAELMENAVPTTPLLHTHNLVSTAPPTQKINHASLLKSEKIISSTIKKMKREVVAPLLPPPPPMDVYSPFGVSPIGETFMAGTPETVVDWEDVWRASALALDDTLVDSGASSPMSSASSEADLMSLAPEYENNRCGTNLYDCTDLKDPDLGHGQHLCKDALFSDLLDDMVVGNWGGSFDDAKGYFNTDKLFADF